MISKEPGVVMSQIEGRNRVEFEPLGATKPPLSKIHAHDCDRCDHLGSLEVGERHHDFYRCGGHAVLVSSLGHDYIARYGSKGHECISFPNKVLRHMGADPGSVENILKSLCTFYNCEVKSVKHGFAILPMESCSSGVPNEIVMLLNPLLEERRVIYIQDAAKKVKDSFPYEPIDTVLLHKIRESISALVDQQINERR
ncbi:hypothetical protein LCGC14_0860690 [marine sediment metagenome]|uniref:Uncharacterized protein n=1 Tax=marine sediment metagenome TaxID=412755 RepID=A0A0F9RS63_9ZZZZ